MLKIRSWLLDKLIGNWVVIANVTIKDHISLYIKEDSFLCMENVNLDLNHGGRVEFKFKTPGEWSEDKCSQ